MFMDGKVIKDGTHSYYLHCVFRISHAFRYATNSVLIAFLDN